MQVAIDLRDLGVLLKATQYGIKHGCTDPSLGELISTAGRIADILMKAMSSLREEIHAPEKSQ